jgi:archaellum component FlaF (FlaF/FlaG flagellin family)
MFWTLTVSAAVFMGFQIFAGWDQYNNSVLQANQALLDKQSESLSGFAVSNSTNKFSVSFVNSGSIAVDISTVYTVRGSNTYTPTFSGTVWTSPLQTGSLTVNTPLGSGSLIIVVSARGREWFVSGP